VEDLAAGNASSFGGKAAPGPTAMAKLIIRLINGIAENRQHGFRHGRPDAGGVPADFVVSLGQKVYPAVDLFEQISTAGKEGLPAPAT